MPIVQDTTQESKQIEKSQDEKAPDNISIGQVEVNAEMKDQEKPIDSNYPNP
jgi:hypothetical protein